MRPVRLRTFIPENFKLSQQTKRIALVLITAAFASGEQHLAPPPRMPVAPETVKSHTTAEAVVQGAWIDTLDRSAVRTTYQDAVASTQSFPTGWSGNVEACLAGTTSAAYKDAVRTRIDWVRGMAGVPVGVALDPVLSAKAQDAALVMSSNGSLTHTPAPSSRCYSANAAEAASKSNLCLGSVDTDPGCILTYIRDNGGNNAFVGHRRWILFPSTLTMGTGDIPAHGANASANALWVLPQSTGGSRPATRDEFIAWPPRGYVPYQVIPARWSLSFPGADFRNAVVTMTRNGTSLGTAIESKEQGYGDNTIVWIPAGLDPNSNASYPQPSADQTVSVTVANVLVGGVARTFTYEAIIFDPYGATAPAAPAGPAPASGSTGVPLNTTLSWAPSAGATDYDVYLGYSNPPPYFATANNNQVRVQFSGPGAVYWRVVAKNSHGSTSSPVWTFAVGETPSCATSLSATALNFNASAQSGTVMVTTGAGCSWTAQSSVAWVVITSGMTRTGSGTVEFAILPNLSTTPRSGTMSIAGTTVTITQSGAAAGTGNRELILQHDDHFGVSAWKMGGPASTQILSSPWFATARANWRIKGAGDFNGDGIRDLVLQDSVTNQVSFWLMTGVDGLQLGPTPVLHALPNWSVRAVGRMNGDSIPDLILQNTVTNAISVWFMNPDATLSSAPVIATAAAGWQIAATGDINQDGATDLLLQSEATNQVSVWFMQAGGLAAIATPITAHPLPGWKLLGTTHLNGDTVPDFVLQNSTTRQISYWYMTGTQGSTSSSAPIVATSVSGWKVRAVW